MLQFLNLEKNKTAEIRWLVELRMRKQMRTVCINSMKENQTLYDCMFCGKLVVAEITVKFRKCNLT